MIIIKPVFITLEGIDGSGKSTQSEKISQWLEDYNGLKTIRTFEPGDWDNGNLLREILLHGKNHSLTDFFLFLADRNANLNKVILPALSSGKNVVCERYIDSTIAYQSARVWDLKNRDVTQIQQSFISFLNDFFFPAPDITIFLNISPEAALKRLKDRNTQTDNFESKGLKFMRDVSNIYQGIAAQNTKRFITVKILENDSPDVVFRKIIASLSEKLQNIDLQSWE